VLKLPSDSRTGYYHVSTQSDIHSQYDTSLSASSFFKLLNEIQQHWISTPHTIIYPQVSVSE